MFDHFRQSRKAAVVIEAALHPAEDPGERCRAVILLVRRSARFAREAVGENYFDMARPCACGADTLVLYGPGDTIVVTAEEQPVRFLLVAGRPLKEPVAWHGPIVMNTQEELRTAFRKYEQGTFVKHPGR